MNRHAFSLFEMLVALGLVGLLLTLCYGSLHHAGVLRTAGQQDSHEDRVARVVLRGFESIVANASPIPEKHGNSTWGEVRSQTNVSRPSLRSTSSHEHHANIGIWGNETFLAVFLNPTEDRQASPLLPSQDRIAVMMERSSGVNGFPRRTSGDMTWRTMPESIRDSSSLLWFEACAARKSSGDGSELCLPRLRPIEGAKWGVKFRYFDGHAWLDSWDTHIRGRNPDAVELTLTGTNRSYQALAIPLQGVRGAQT